MRKIHLISLLSALLIAPLVASAQQAADTAWFNEAKFGMFIHWGLYSELGRGEWVMNKEQIPIAEYKAMASNFNPVKFNADEWVAVAKAAGMKYMTITAKHHDGFCMFDTDVDDFNMVDGTPFKRDVIKELSEACAKEGIQFGVYYSQAQDWSHPGGNMSSKGYWDPAQLKGADHFRTYLDEVSIPQMKEVIKIANPSHMWFDTPMGMTEEIGAEIVAAIREVDPNILLNSRLMFHGNQVQGLNADHLQMLREIGVDFLSYRDRTIPANPFSGWNWETCMTLNGSWGYNTKDSAWKTPQEVVKMLSQIASKGGNFLLNFGPTSEGILPAEGVGIVKQVGAWLQVNGEAIYGTQASSLNETGTTTVGPGVNADGSMKETKAQTRKSRPEKVKHKKEAFDWVATSRPVTDGAPAKIYLHIFNWKGGAFEVKGITDKVTEAYLLSDAKRSPLKFSQSGEAFSVELPKEAPDPIATVVCLEYKTK